MPNFQEVYQSGNASIENKMIVLTLAAAMLVSSAAIEEKRASHRNDFIGFSAGLTQKASLSGNSSLAFDRVWLNAGDGYDNSTGEFTCPRPGTYVFMFNGLASSAGTLQLALYRNGRYEVSSYAHNTGDYASASNSVVLTLYYGDTISIHGQGTVSLYGATDEVYSTFSGLLLYPANVATSASPATVP